MMLFAENSGKYLNIYSSHFKSDFIKVLSRRYVSHHQHGKLNLTESHGTKRVHANLVYQEYISDRNHYHMNATRWHSLAEFVKHLGREGIAEIDETPKGWFLRWIDNSPEALARQAAIDKKERSEKSEEERESRLLAEQIEKAHSTIATGETEYTELLRVQEAEPIKLKLEMKAPPKPAGLNLKLDGSKSKLVTSKPAWTTAKTAPPSSSSSVVSAGVKQAAAPLPLQPKKKSALEEIMEREKRKRELYGDEADKRRRLTFKTLKRRQLPMSSLKDLLKQRIVEDVIQNAHQRGGSRWKLLIVDPPAMRVLTCACKADDIINQNVTSKAACNASLVTLDPVIEQLTNKRAPSDNDAIYLLSPAPETVDMLIADFTRGRPLYPAVHLYFISGLPESLYEKIKRSQPLMQKVKTFIELNIDFIAVEPQAFSVDLPFSFSAALNAPTLSLLNYELEPVAKRLVAVLATLGEYPYIRYYNPPGAPTAVATQERVAGKLAGMTSQKYSHIADVMSYLGEAVKKFKEENKAAQYQNGQASAGDTFDQISKMKDALSSLPQFTLMKEKFALHTSICEKFQRIYSEYGIQDLSSLEQDVAVGETAEGKQVKTAGVDVLSLISERRICHSDKVRLLMQYIISQEGLQDSERQQLYDRAQLTLEEKQAVTNLHALGVRLSASIEKRKTEAANPYAIATLRKTRKKKDVKTKLGT
ncbi:vacuolar sorting protein VPS33/slp1 [Irineochytrium annulatum]|nr:vacuolar sorting protein VPS33/slp1 [Irineochytrium annulatum]